MMLGRIAPLVTVAACVAALAGPGAATGAASGGVETPQLRAVSSRVEGGGVNSIVIGGRPSAATELQAVLRVPVGR